MGRFLFVCLAMQLSVFVFANNALFTPTASVLQTNEVQLDDFYGLGQRANEYGQVSVGLGDGFELGYAANRFNRTSYGSSVNIEYDYLVPFTDYAPGIAFGVIDGLNRTTVGRQFYFVASFSIGLNYDLQQSLAATVSFGYLAGNRTTPFVNAMIPLGGSVSYIVEDDGNEINTGFDLRILKPVTLRVAMRGSATLVGLRWNWKF